MWIARLLLLSSIVGFVYGKTSTIYYPHQFANNELCAVLKCGPEDLCIVSDNNAVCMHKQKLHEVEGEHIDSTTGKVIQHDVHEKEHFKMGIKKASHRHEHMPRHYEHNEEPKTECGEQELHRIGGRLLQWFIEMHKVSGADVEVSSQKRDVECRPDVAWMFEQWDGNNDGELSVKELAPLESDANEKCLKAFIDRCDTDPGNDDVITLEEWCDCFAWADDDRHEPPCHAAKHLEDPHLLGVFHPRCTLDGYYKPEQCHENECWCVDKYGREFEKSRVVGQLPDCGQYATQMSDEEQKELAAEL
uniref:Testican-3 n=1 Tax=Ascaris suum TaxID=6253 RepID=F1L7N3_ASCSU